MAVPATIIKVKGTQALNALCTNGQLPWCLKVKGAALAAPGAGALKTLELEGVRVAATKGAIVPAVEMELGGAKVVAAKSALVGAGQGKAAAAQGALLGSWKCYGLCPWSLTFLLASLGLAAVAYYYYRRNRQLSEEFAEEVAPV